MFTLTRYIFRLATIALLFATGTLTAAVWLSQSLKLVDLIVNRGLPLSTFLHMAALTLPAFMVIVLPIALFSAVLFTYNKLTMDSELIVMRASGASELGLARPALYLAAATLAVSYFLQLFLVPYAYRDFKDLQFAARNNFSTMLLREGAFNALGDSLTVYVRERRVNGELLGILVHDERDLAHPVTLMAERGALVHSNQGPRVLLINGNRQEVSKENGQLSLLYFERYSVDVTSLSGEGAAHWREPRERYLGELLDPGDSPPDIAYRGKLIAEGHQRLSSPLHVPALVLIALAAILTGRHERRGQTHRILAAVAAAVALQSVEIAVSSASASMPIVLPLLYIVPLIVIAGGLYLLFGPGRFATGRARPQAA